MVVEVVIVMDGVDFLARALLLVALALALVLAPAVILVLLCFSPTILTVRHCREKQKRSNKFIHGMVWYGKKRDIYIT